MRLYKGNQKASFSLGFTLVELLIVLLILGVISTFTIPKIIVAQQNSSFNAKAKETIGTIAGAYSTYTSQNGYSINTGIGNLTPYMNYISVDTASNIDSYYSNPTVATNCSTASGACLKLHNGAYLMYWPAATFSGNAANNGIPVLFDPDGQVTDGTSTGPGKSVYFFLYYSGRIVDLGNLVPNTSWSTNSNWQPNPSQVPPWFSW